jgi:hypothetical protein
VSYKHQFGAPCPHRNIDHDQTRFNGVRQRTQDQANGNPWRKPGRIRPIPSRILRDLNPRSVIERTIAAGWRLKRSSVWKPPTSKQPRSRPGLRPPESLHRSGRDRETKLSPRYQTTFQREYDKAISDSAKPARNARNNRWTKPCSSRPRASSSTKRRRRYCRWLRFAKRRSVRVLSLHRRRAGPRFSRGIDGITRSTSEIPIKSQSCATLNFHAGKAVRPQ